MRRGERDFFCRRERNIISITEAAAPDTVHVQDITADFGGALRPNSRNCSVFDTDDEN